MWKVNKNGRKFGPKGHARSMKKCQRVKNKKIQKQFPKFIANSMPFTICYLNKSFMS